VIATVQSQSVIGARAECALFGFLVEKTWKRLREKKNGDSTLVVGSTSPTYRLFHDNFGWNEKQLTLPHSIVVVA